jgi:poly-beta-1,6-N-acetyl-D-glucosamine N-deacetylase
MRCLMVLTFCLLLLSRPAQAQEFMALCYHDIADQVSGPNAELISTAQLVQHFDWLRANSYRVVSIDDLLAARDGRRPLPDKAVLLSFDDGYVSFYTRAFPLLKAFGYPAVLALEGSWLDAPPDAEVTYDNRQVPRSRFLSWQQLREIRSSGLVEIASHSYDLHRGILANPQGNLEPALTARTFDPRTGRYENDAAHLNRIRADLTRNSRLLERQLGVRPRVMVWPFGRYHQPAVAMAAELGMPLTLTLESGASSTEQLERIRRYLVPGDQQLEDLVGELRHPDQLPPSRVAHVDLDYVFDPDPVQQERNLDRLLDRIKDLRINTVFLQAFADPDGNGTADALYFPNRRLPVRADLFNRVAWQLKTRTGVKVYAWLPVLGFELGNPDLSVQTAPGGTPAAPAYRRLSPFAPEARALILELYEDLARHADFEGLLFHDDAYLTDFEDASPAALAWYRKQWQLPADLADIRSDPALRQRWSRAKTEALLDWTDELTERIRRWRPMVKTARNLYAEVALEPASETWYAQNLELFLARYDFTAIMAMPYLERAEHPEAWLEGLVNRVKREPNGLEKTIFELQTFDWNDRSKQIPATVITAQMRLLQRLGAVNFGYYPDDFIGDHPQARELHRALSLQTYPYRP